MINQMIGIKVHDKEPIDRAIRRFKKACDKAGLSKDIKRASHFVKPSEKRKLAKRVGRKRLLRQHNRNS
jgi:small subunit ribosomal protein S21